MAIGYKIFAELVTNKLEEMLEENNLLDDTQFGFRKNRETIDVIYTVKSATEASINNDKGLIFLFLAYHKKETIWRRLEEMGIDENLKRCIFQIDEKTYCQIKVDSEVIDAMEIEHGVRQGCPLSSILFNAAFSDLESEMRKAQRAGVIIEKKRYGRSATQTTWF